MCVFGDPIYIVTYLCLKLMFTNIPVSNDLKKKSNHF